MPRPLGLLALALAPGLLASTAFAQAPGEVAPTGPSGYPVAPVARVAPVAPGAPPVAVAPAPVQSPAMEHRFGIGLSLGGLSVVPDNGPGDVGAGFRVAELAIRYRASRRFELELAMSGGRQTVGDGLDGELATGSVTAALRYRFMPDSAWNWFLLAGLGGTVIAPHDSTAAERDGMTRPLGMFGIGVERRFRHFAIQAELRGIQVGPQSGVGKFSPQPDPLPPQPAGLAPANSYTVNAEELGGGMLTIGASYYF